MSNSNKSSKRTLWQKIKKLLKVPTQQASTTQQSKSTDSNVSNDKSAGQAQAKQKTTTANQDSHSNDNHKSSHPKQSNMETTSHDGQHDDSIDHSSPLTDYIRQILDSHEWHYKHNAPDSDDKQRTHYLSLWMKKDNESWRCLVRIQEQTQLVCVYGILPFTIPKSHRNSAILLITQLNYGMVLGNIEMDIHDGEVRFKNSVDMESTGMNEMVVNHLLQSVFSLTLIFYDMFKEFLSKENPTQDLDTLLDELYQKTEAQQYFLATEQIQ